jgi:hypothetical protein
MGIDFQKCSFENCFKNTEHTWLAKVAKNDTGQHMASETFKSQSHFEAT